MYCWSDGPHFTGSALKPQALAVVVGTYLVLLRGRGLHFAHMPRVTSHMNASAPWQGAWAPGTSCRSHWPSLGIASGVLRGYRGLAFTSHLRECQLHRPLESGHWLALLVMVDWLPSPPSPVLLGAQGFIPLTCGPSLPGSPGV